MEKRVHGLVTASFWGGLTGVVGILGWSMATVSGPASATSFIDLAYLLLVALFGWLFAIVIVGLANVLVGLPVSFVLRKLGWEHPVIYTLAGGLAGYLIPVIGDALSQPAVYMTPVDVIVFCALSGAVSGAFWGRWRRWVLIGETKAEDPIAHDRGERWLR